MKVVREDPKNPDVLYAGMERGIQASWDGGKSWSSIRNNLPPVSVRDIQVHPRDNDLVIGTHGRGAWILDDATPLQKLADAMKQDAYLFDVRPAVRWTSWNRDAALGQRTFSADNPPDGALIDFYLKAKPEKPVTLTITDGSGEKVEDIQVKEPKAGVNRVVWNLRHEGPAPIEGRTDEGGGFFARFGSLGPLAMPGEYRVTLDLEAHKLSASAMVKGDPAHRGQRRRLSGTAHRCDRASRSPKPGEPGHQHHPEPRETARRGERPARRRGKPGAEGAPDRDGGNGARGSEGAQRQARASDPGARLSPVSENSRGAALALLRRQRRRGQSPRSLSSSGSTSFGRRPPTSAPSSKSSSAPASRKSTTCSARCRASG